MVFIKTMAEDTTTLREHLMAGPSAEAVVEWATTRRVAETILELPPDEETAEYATHLTIGSTDVYAGATMETTTVDSTSLTRKKRKAYLGT